VPADFLKTPVQGGDIDVVADAVEPFEHECRILTLLASRGDWDFLIVDWVADGLREDFRLRIMSSQAFMYSFQCSRSAASLAENFQFL
jgi:hypothetical protein